MLRASEPSSSKLCGNGRIENLLFGSMAHAICRCSLQDLLKLMSMTRKMLMSKPKVTCASRSVRPPPGRAASVPRLIVPFASIVIVTETRPADQLRVPLVKHEGRDVELRRVGVNLNADHVEHADVSDYRQADHDLRAKAEFHPQRRTRLLSRPRYRASPGRRHKPWRWKARRT